MKPLKNCNAAVPSEPSLPISSGCYIACIENHFVQASLADQRLKKSRFVAFSFLKTKVGEALADHRKPVGPYCILRHNASPRIAGREC
jgi:hypothetical protein